MLKPIENGDFLDEKLSKYATIGDYEIGNLDLVAVFVDSVSPQNFVAKFQFVDLCETSRILAKEDGKNIKIPLKMIREATLEDGNIYKTSETDIKGNKPSDIALINKISKPLIEKKFSIVVILGDCSDEIIDILKNSNGAMGMDEVLAGAGVYRRLG